MNPWYAKAAILDDIMAVITAPFNPIREALAELKLFFKELVQDAISDAIGIDIDALDDLLKHPSRFVCLDDTQFTFPPPVGTVNVSLFPAGEHDRLDGILHLAEPHHVDEPGLPEGCGRLLDTAEVNAGAFAAYGDTITTAKLLLLDGTELNHLLSDLLGRTISVYGADQNFMIDGLEPETWLKLIDGDHAWRADGQPRFCATGATCAPAATPPPAPNSSSCAGRHGQALQTRSGPWKSASPVSRPRAVSVAYALGIRPVA